jgi:hypothetical protein
MSCNVTLECGGRMPGADLASFVPSARKRLARWT